MYRFLLHRLRRSVAFFVIMSTCSLNESLLSRIIHKYLSHGTSSRGVKFGVGGLTFSTFLASVMVLSSISMWHGGEEGVDIT